MKKIKKPKEIKTQLDAVKRHLFDYRSITSFQAFEEYGITRLSGLIFKLRKEGWGIQSKNITKKNRYGNTVTFVKYILEDKEN